MPVAPFRTVAEVAQCEQYAYRDFFAPMPTPDGGEVRIPGLPYRPHPATHSDDRIAPGRGRDTEAVLAELLDLDESAISRVTGSAVVADPAEAPDSASSSALKGT